MKNEKLPLNEYLLTLPKEELVERIIQLIEKKSTNQKN